MDTAAVGVLVNVLVFAAIVYFIYTLAGDLHGAATEIKEQQAREGDTNFAALYISLPAEVFLLLRVLSAVGGFLVGSMAINFVLGAVLAVAGFFLPVLYLRRLRQKRIATLEIQLIEGLELMGNSLKSGLTIQQAVELLVDEFPAPISQEFSLVMAENRLGVEFTEALGNMADRLDSTVFHILASGVAITKRCGGDLTEIFQSIATTIREQATIEGKLNAVTAQGRFQALILGGMPFALMVILYFVDRNHVETLFGYQLGIWAVTAVVIMVIIAQLWIRKLLSIDI